VSFHSQVFPNVQLITVVCTQHVPVNGQIYFNVLFPQSVVSNISHIFQHMLVNSLLYTTCEVQYPHHLSTCIPTFTTCAWTYINVEACDDIESGFSSMCLSIFNSLTPIQLCSLYCRACLTTGIV